MAHARWLVLGLGNRLAGADAFGPSVLARLAQSPALPDWIDLVDAHTDVLALMHRFGEYERVVLVDVVLDPRGGVAVVDEETFSRWADRSPGVHQVSPIMAVKLFRRLRAAEANTGLPVDARAAAAQARPSIALVAHFVGEAEFGRGPGEEAIAAGAAAVRRLIGERG